MTVDLTHPWFYYDDIPAEGEEVVLSGNEARHATGARRLEVGDHSCLFNGKGLVAVARIQTLDDRGRTPVLLIESVNKQTRPEVEIHLASALPKGDRQGVMLDMATQIGIRSFTPLLCTRSVTRASEKSLARFRRLVIEACKQSRQAFLPEIKPATTTFEVAQDNSATILFAHPGAGKLCDVLGKAGQSASLVIMVGPEGGFTDDEVRALEDRGANGVSLGRGILRTETAAITMLAYARLALARD